MSLYPPSVWFADVMTPFSGVTFALVCFILTFMLTLKSRPYVQSSFDMRAPRKPRVLLFSSCLFGDVAFSEYCFVPLLFSLCVGSTPYVLSFRMVFLYLVVTGWLFGISLCENSIKSKMEGTGKFLRSEYIFVSPRDNLNRQHPFLELP